MSAVNPKYIHPKNNDTSVCNNEIKQNFTTDKPNLVWGSDITYVKANGTFYYICVIIDLFLRKVISYAASNKSDTQLVVNTFKKRIIIETALKILYFIQTDEVSIQQRSLEICLTNMALFKLLPPKVILMIMLSLNLFLIFKT